MRFESYRKLPTGKFENADDLGPTLFETSNDDWWTYKPRAGAELRFVRPNGEVIQPTEFLTDLGTVPPLFRIGRLLQPDGLPAVALIHDWIVRLNNCGQGTHKFDESNRIQQEALKTWMVAHPRDYSIIVFYLSRWALRTNRSRRGWCLKLDHCPPTLVELLAARRSL